MQRSGGTDDVTLSDDDDVGVAVVGAPAHQVLSCRPHQRYTATISGNAARMLTALLNDPRAFR